MINTAVDDDALRTSGLEICGAGRNATAGMAAAYGQVVEWSGPEYSKSRSRPHL